MLCNVKCTACTVWTTFSGNILCKSVKLTEPPDAEPHVRWCERSTAKVVSYSIKFQDDYYDAIAKCHVEGESTVFIEFMLTQINNILEELLNQMTNSATDDAILDAGGANYGADNMEGRLLSGLKQNPYITQTDLAKELSLSRRTVQRIMKELMNDGKVKRVGSTRTGHWEIKD